MQFRQELILTSGGPRNAVDKKKREKNDGKNIYYVFSTNSISVMDI